MKLTRSIGYALLAVGYIAQNGQAGPVQAKSIARHHRLPLEYLLKILQQLVRADVLGSIRGPNGGFHLAYHPEKVSLLRIIQAVETPSDKAPAFSAANVNAPYHRAALEGFRHAAHCAAQDLDRITLADLLNSGSAAPPADTDRPAREP